MKRVSLCAACLAVAVDAIAAGGRIATVVQPIACDPANGRATLAAVHFETDASFPEAELAAVSGHIDGAENLAQTHGVAVSLHQYLRGIAFVDLDIRGVRAGRRGDCTPAQVVDATVTALRCTAQRTGVEAMHVRVIRGWVFDQTLGQRHEHLYSRDELAGIECPR